ncbi:hypothetical protein EYC95_07490 [Pseudomonas sp. BGI-2]|nr:hypothetical protein EYC95_07490 [Pseudomonas sp. BGI-2]
MDQNTARPDENPPVGAGLLAKGPSASISMLTDTPLSRASPLPQGGCGVSVTPGTDPSISSGGWSGS